MSDRAHLFLALTALVSIFFILRMVRKHHLRSKYSLLWISIVLVMAPVAAFPGLLDDASFAIGISYPPATFLLLAVAFLFLVVVQFSWGSLGSRSGVDCWPKRSRCSERRRLPPRNLRVVTPPKARRRLPIRGWSSRPRPPGGGWGRTEGRGRRS